jgi:hypothetical protein
MLLLILELSFVFSATASARVVSSFQTLIYAFVLFAYGYVVVFVETPKVLRCGAVLAFALGIVSSTQLLVL